MPNHLTIPAVPKTKTKPFYMSLVPSKTKDINDLIKDADAWPAIQSAVDEALRCKQKISHEQENIKALRDGMRDQYGLHPKLFNAYVAATYNNDYLQRLEGLSQEQVLLEHVVNDYDPLPAVND